MVAFFSDRHNLFGVQYCCDLMNISFFRQARRRLLLKRILKSDPRLRGISPWSVGSVEAVSIQVVRCRIDGRDVNILGQRAH
uniref:hypothetical protein n=1 Tax=Nonomuraea sp. CA-252377 TaxID=3240003 RepID=UPI003F49660F